MKHINLRRVTKATLGLSEKDFAIVDGASNGYAIKYLRTNQYIDHDFTAREDDSDYAGTWNNREEAEKFVQDAIFSRNHGTCFHY